MKQSAIFVRYRSYSSCQSYRDYLFIYQPGIVAGAPMIGISIIWKGLVVKRPLLRWSHASSSCDHGPMADMLCFTV
jgi:hypothetical protein